MLRQAFHCHIAPHLSLGLGVQFVERIEEIPGNVGVTPAWEQLCNAWDEYFNAVVPEQTDSGV